jgi:polyisoprenoid-binding protein YceI
MEPRIGDHCRGDHDHTVASHEPTGRGPSNARRETMKAMICAGLMTLTLTAAAHAPSVTVPFSATSKLWLDGTSTVRSYTCRASRVDGSVELQPAQAARDVATGSKSVKAGTVTVAVGALACGNDTMDDHMRKALKSAEHATIRFRMTDYELVPGGAQAAVKMRGTLTIAGQERPVVIDGTAQPEGTTGLRVKGSTVVRMQDYGVKPPTLMMGTLKVGENATVHFDVALQP